MISDRLQILLAQFDDWSRDAVNQRVSTYRRLMAGYDIALSSAFFIREAHEAATAEASEVLKELMMDPEVRNQLF